MSKSQHAIYPEEEGMLRDRIAHRLRGAMGKIALLGFGVILGTAAIFGSSYYYNKRVEDGNQKFFSALTVLDSPLAKEKSETTEENSDGLVAYKTAKEREDAASALFKKVSSSIKVSGVIPLVRARYALQEGACADANSSKESLDNYKTFLASDLPSSSWKRQGELELAFCYQRSGRCKEALDIYNTLSTSLDYTHNRQEVLYQRALVMRALGNNQAAQADYKELSGSDKTTVYRNLALYAIENQ